MESRGGLLGIGVDLVDMMDVKKIRFTKRFCEFFLTNMEIKKLPKSQSIREQFIASRFAVKEAVIKAMPIKISPLEFEIRKNRNKPFVYFCSKDQNAFYDVLISISHTGKFALGFAIATTK